MGFIYFYRIYNNHYFTINFIVAVNLNWGWGLGIGDWAQSPIPNPQLHYNLYNIFLLIFK